MSATLSAPIFWIAVHTKGRAAGSQTIKDIYGLYDDA